MFFIRSCKNVVLFQSTLPRGERPLPTSTLAFIVSFNPRSRVGSDERGQSVRGITTTSFNPRSRVGSDLK